MTVTVKGFAYGDKPTVISKLCSFPQLCGAFEHPSTNSFGLTTSN